MQSSAWLKTPQLLGCPVSNFGPSSSGSKIAFPNSGILDLPRILLTSRGPLSAAFNPEDQGACHVDVYSLFRRRSHPRTFVRHYTSRGLQSARFGQGGAHLSGRNSSSKYRRFCPSTATSVRRNCLLTLERR